ncbi:MAG: beta-1,3-glucanase family protein [Vulcanimicrobiaceae bacterium]
MPSGSQVFAYVIGLVGSTGTFYRLDASGTPHPLAASDNTQKAGTFPGSSGLSAAAASALTPNYPQAWADYSIPVSLTSATKISLANINPTTMLGLGTGTSAFSGRIYISVGVPRLPFTVQAGGYTAPVFTTQPGYLTLFDWIEFSYDSLGNFNGNTTQVDQFGFSLMLDGTPGGTLQGVLTASRSTIMNAAVKAVSAFGSATLSVAVPAAAASAYPAGLNLLRVVSPKTANASGSFSTYFDAAIGAAYTKWQTTPLVTHEQSTSAYYTGYVPASGPNAGVLVFVSGNHPTLADASSQPTAFAVPAAGGVIPTNDVWQCANSLASGSADQKNVQKQIAAMFNRGLLSTLLDDAACPDPVTFYPPGSSSNLWAHTFHTSSLNRLAYGFPYDDVCNRNPSISLTSTASVTITLGKFFS